MNAKAITGKNIEELKTYEHGRFIDVLDPHMLYPYNVFSVPGFDPMEFA